ncbi:MAG: hypothetical protein IT547_02900 [Hyphomonadaceae bacterium]|nr:hypothetical protein [Hyphomonadaceae bacterium]
MASWRDVQLNHIWSRSNDPDCFSAPANLCAAPAFLAKLTDHDHDIAALLRRRAFDLYGWRPALEREPPIPVGHASLKWAEPLSPVADLESLLRQRLSAKPRSTAAQIARQIGWAFSDFKPDTQVGAASD